MLFGTATHSLTFTARKSDLLNVSKSTDSSNNGSTFTFEKSILSFAVKNPLLSLAVFCASSSAALVLSLFDEAVLLFLRLLSVGSFFVPSVKSCKIIYIPLNLYKNFCTKLY